MNSNIISYCIVVAVILRVLGRAMVLGHWCKKPFSMSQKACGMSVSEEKTGDVNRMTAQFRDAWHNSIEWGEFKFSYINY